MEDIFKFFKSELSSDIVSETKNHFSSLLEDSEIGLKLKDIPTMNHLAEFIVLNLDIVDSFSLQLVERFFVLASEGLIKEKCFDDKLHEVNISQILNIVVMIVEQTSTLLDRNELIRLGTVCSLVQLCHVAVDFVLQFVTEGLSFKKISLSHTHDLGFTTVTYLPIKRKINKRQCELINEATNNAGTDLKVKNNEESNSNKTQVAKNLRVFEESNIIIVFIDFIQRNSNNYLEITLIILEILSITSNDMKVAEKLISYGFLKDLAYLIYDHKQNFRDHIVKLSLEVFWNLLEKKERKAALSIQTDDIIHIFRELLCLTIINGYKTEDRVLRNEIIVLLIHLIDGCPYDEIFDGRYNNSSLVNILTIDWRSPSFCFLSLPELIFYICVHDDVIADSSQRIIPQSGLNSRKKLLDLSNEDVQFKKAALNCMGVILAYMKDSALAEEYLKGPLIRIILSCFEVQNSAQSIISARFSITQLRDIQQECLKVLDILSQKFSIELIEHNVVEILVNFIDKQREDSRVVTAINALTKLTVSGGQKIKDKFSSTNALDILTDVINTTEGQLTLSEDDLIRLKAAAFDSLAEACSECHIRNQSLLAQKGLIEVMVIYLKNSKMYSGEKNTILIIAFFKALWNIVLENNRNQEIFLESDGFYSLMEFIEGVSYHQKKQPLSFLASLLDDRVSLRYFEEWISPASGLTSTHLLLKLYREEDARMGSVYSDGVLQCTDRPLNTLKMDNANKKTVGGKTRLAQVSRTLPTTKTMDIEENFETNEIILMKYFKKISSELDLRRVIYSIFFRAGFDHHALSKADEQLMVLIKVYPFLRNFEIWTDIKNKLKGKGVVLTFEDSFFLDSNIEKCKKVIENSVSIQNQILGDLKQIQEEDLQKFFDLVKNQKKYVQ